MNVIGKPEWWWYTLVYGTHEGLAKSLWKQPGSKCFSLVRRAVSVPTTYLCYGSTNGPTTYLFPHIFLCCSPSCVLRNGLSLNLELRLSCVAGGELRGSPCLCFPGAGVTDTRCYAFFKGSELKSSCWCDGYFADWVPFPAHPGNSS